jgi:hypothetical protein
MIKFDIINEQQYIFNFFENFRKKFYQNKIKILSWKPSKFLFDQKIFFINELF